MSSCQTRHTDASRSASSPSRLLPLCALSLPAFSAPPRPQLNITGYVITAELDPANTKLSATADVTFTALEDLTQAVFELNNGLNINKITDATGTSLNSERLTPNSTVHVTLPTPLAKGASTTFHFEYSGILTGSDTSPVEGIKLAAIADPISILLYPGAWFPMTGLFTDRFTAVMHIRVPAGYTAVGSGTPAKKTLPDGGRTEFSFTWAKPGFPGTIVAGKFLPPINGGLNNIHVYVTEKRKDGAADFAGARRPRVRVHDQHLRPARIRPHQHRRAARGLRLRLLGAGDGLHRRQPHRRSHRSLTRLLSNTLAHQWWGPRSRPPPSTTPGSPTACRATAS